MYLRITISRFSDDLFPGWVQCSMVDALGQVHHFEEKAPVVTDALFDEGSNFPRPGFIACSVIAIRNSVDGRQIAQIDTRTPWGVEATDGKTKFEVFLEQLCDQPLEESD